MQNAGMETLTPSRLALFGVWYVVFLFSSTMHEAAHALAAKLGGDDTAYHGGQVTLNPLPHIQREPFGMVIVPLMSFFFMGWMMGWASTPYDPLWAQRYPRRQALMSAAGPAANLLIAILAFVSLSSLLSSGVFVPPDPELLSFSQLAVPAAQQATGSLWYPAAAALSVALSLNLLLFTFNLVPLPPLDGSGVLRGIFPMSVGRLLDMLSANPMMGLLGLLLAWQVFPPIFQPIFRTVLEMLHPGVYGG